MNMIVQKIENKKSLKEYSSFRIGGAALYFVTVQSSEELIAALSWSKEKNIPFLILGNGSNILLPDQEFPGLVIYNKINFIQREGLQVTVGSGVPLPSLALTLSKEGLGGLEFCGGIPGTIGGGVVMNAGAFNQDMAAIVQEVHTINQQGIVSILQKSDLQFGYRTSILQHSKNVVLSATLQLYPSATALTTLREWTQKRKKLQPYTSPSCGCIFRNPPKGPSAGALIDHLGFKGKSVGGAAVSTQHANFIINQGGATASDVIHLIDQIEEVVQNKTGYLLQREIHYAPGIKFRDKYV